MFLKKSSSKSTLKNIITINAFAEENYVYSEDIFKSTKELTFNTSNFITSYIGNKDLISAKINLSRNIPEEDISDILNIKAYEELGLDDANSYVITHYEIESDQEEREYHLFVADTKKLDALYFPIKDKTKYIDLLLPEPLLYKTLYKKEILQDNQMHGFIYLTKDNASVIFYNNGEYVYSKSIEFSLSQIYDKYCELVGEKVDETTFFSLLEQEGLKTTNSDYQENFMKIFSEVFITINDIIIYAKRAFDLENIDQIFIGSSIGPIIGLDEYSQNYLGLNSSDFNFDYNVNNEEWYVDQYQYLMLLSSLDYIDDEADSVNLSIYPRPPSFLNRASGQFIVATFLAISLSLAYPISYLVGSYANDAKVFSLKGEDEKLSKEAKKYKKIISEKISIIKQLDGQFQNITNIYSGKTKTLIAIYNKKVKYKLKSGLFHTLAEDLAKYKVQIDELRTEDNTLYISLISNDDRKFTELIKYISKTHFNDIKEIDIERISKDAKDNYYKGLLKVVE